MVAPQLSPLFPRVYRSTEWVYVRTECNKDGLWIRPVASSLCLETCILLLLQNKGNMNEVT